MKKLHWLQTENTPYRFVEAGTIAEVDDDLAARLIAEGIAEPVKVERAVKAKAETAVKK